MFKRTTLVTKNPWLSRDEFAALWTGEHLELATGLPGLREYVIDFVIDPRTGDPDGVATVRFDTRAACDAAFATPGLGADLLRTRDAFASQARVLHVEEHIVALPGDGGR